MLQFFQKFRVMHKNYPRLLYRLPKKKRPDTKKFFQKNLDKPPEI